MVVHHSKIIWVKIIGFDPWIFIQNAYNGIDVSDNRDSLSVFTSVTLQSEQEALWTGLEWEDRRIVGQTLWTRTVVQLGQVLE